MNVDVDPEHVVGDETQEHQDGKDPPLGNLDGAASFAVVCSATMISIAPKSILAPLL